MFNHDHPADWTPTVVYDLAEWVNGLAFRDIQFSPAGKPIIKIAELKGGISGQTRFTQNVFDESVHVKAGDMLFSWSGNPETSIDVFVWAGEDGWLNQHIFKLTPKSGIERRFLFYILKFLKPSFVRIAGNKQTTGLGHVTIRDLKAMTVGVPKPNEQCEIIDALAPLDDKIDLIGRENVTIDALVQAVFTNWFVDSVATKQPDGWTSRAVYDCADYINGAAFRSEHFSQERKGLPVVKIGELKDGITPQTKFTELEREPKYRISSGEILFSWSGSPDTSIDTFVWTGGDGWLNQHIFKIQFKRPIEKFFVYYLLRHLKPEFIEIARNKQTTGLGHVTAQDLKRMQVAFPPDELLMEFNQVAEPLFQKVFSNLNESRTLAELRDTLLPKLLSGEIRVPEAKARAKEALR